MQFLTKILAPWHRYRRTLAAGRYNGHADYTGHLSDADHPAVAAEEKAAKSAFGLATFIAGDVVMGMAGAVTSAVSMVAAAVVSAAAGLWFYARQYKKCKKAAAEKITEVNLAGQTVEGARGDLYTLHAAQTRLIALSIDFRNAAKDCLKNALGREIENVQKNVAAECARVRVIDGGPHGAGRDGYAFDTAQLTPLAQQRRHHGQRKRRR